MFSFMFIFFVRCCAGVVFCTATSAVDMSVLYFCDSCSCICAHFLSPFLTVAYEFNYRV